MGAHAELTIGLSPHERYRGILSFSLIVAPTQVPCAERLSQAISG